MTKVYKRMTTANGFRQVLLHPGLPSPLTGRVYQFDTAKTALTKLQERLKGPPLYCEYQYPRQPEGKGNSWFIDRLSQIDLSGVCAQLIRVYQQFDNPIVGEFVFTGPWAELARTSIANGDGYFGARLFTELGSIKDTQMVLRIVTFDLAPTRTEIVGNLRCLVRPSPEFYVGETQLRLTTKESLALFCLVEATVEKRVATHAELFYQLYGHNHSVVDEYQVLLTFVSRIRRKLRLAGAKLTIHAVRNTGYELLLEA